MSIKQDKNRYNVTMMARGVQIPFGLTYGRFRVGISIGAVRCDHYH